MEYDINYFRVSLQNIKPQKGIALVAEPGLSDLYFKRSVILITEHTKEGSMGFVLNKLLDVKVADMIEDFPVNDSFIMLGGPVEPDSLHFIHTLGSLIPGSTHICHSIFWGGDFEVLKQLFISNRISENQVRFFVGHAGWTPGQLSEEIKNNSWALVELSESDIMENDFYLWKKSVERLGNNYNIWMNYPENPNLN